jgi:galactokinase/mevalonate kinase-like predicted kinase
MGNVFSVFRGRAKKNKVSVRKRLSIKRTLTKKELNLQAYMSDFGGMEFLELKVSEELYRKLKDEADQVVLEYENEKEWEYEDYDEKLMVF